MKSLYRIILVISGSISCGDMKERSLSVLNQNDHVGFAALFNEANSDEDKKTAFDEGMFHYRTVRSRKIFQILEANAPTCNPERAITFPLLSKIVDFAKFQKARYYELERKFSETYTNHLRFDYRWSCHSVGHILRSLSNYHELQPVWQTWGKQLYDEFAPLVLESLQPDYCYPIIRSYDISRFLRNSLMFGGNLLDFMGLFDNNHKDLQLAGELLPSFFKDIVGVCFLEELIGLYEDKNNAIWLLENLERNIQRYKANPTEFFRNSINETIAQVEKGVEKYRTLKQKYAFYLKNASKDETLKGIVDHFEEKFGGMSTFVEDAKKQIEITEKLYIITFCIYSKFIQEFFLRITA